MLSQRAPFGLAVALLVASPSAGLPLTPQSSDVESALHFDWIDAQGALQGGALALDPTDPLHVDTRTPEERTQGQLLALGSGTNVTTLLDNGPTNRRVDLVLVGDGYTQANLGTFANDTNSVLAGFFQESPLDEYESFFNVHRVDVVSNESGVDNDPTQGISRDTALGMGFWCGGTERLLCVNVGSALAFADLAPARDTVLVLANSSKYGGAGYLGSNVATLSGHNGAAIELALHEFGHSFGLLADEYTYGGPDVWSGGEPSRANVSTYASATMAALEAKWHEWLGTSGVATFEGANYSSSGIYRPTNDSLMRNLSRPFDPVNTEQIIRRLYEVVSPIDDATPAGTYSTATTFFVEPVQPVNHALSVRWLLDGTPIAGATSATLDASTLGLGNGTFTLEAEVVDETPLVVDPAIRAAYLTERRTWLLTDGAFVSPLEGCSLNPAGSLALGAGNPSIGASIGFDVVNPLGAQPAGSFGALAISTQSLDLQGCGVFVPGLSMAGPGLPGELLVGIAAPALVALEFGAPTLSAGAASRIDVAIPPDPTLIGADVYVQGALLTPGPGGLTIGLARGLWVRIGT